MGSLEFAIYLAALFLLMSMPCWGQGPGRGPGRGEGGMSGANSTMMGGNSSMSAEETNATMSAEVGNNSTMSEETGGMSSIEVDFGGLPLGERCEPDADEMHDDDIPCHSCACFPSEENGRGPQGRYKCQLYGTSQTCQALQDLWQQIDEPCNRDDVIEGLTEEDQCSCKCNPSHYEWKCEANEDATEPLSPACTVILNHRYIERPPARTQDVTVLYPQSCSANNEEYLMGHVMVRPGCEVCVCVDGLWQCVRKAENCHAGNELIQTAVSCSDRTSSFYPIGTYAQEGPFVRICVFGEWEDASFAASISKRGECPVVESMEGDPACEGAPSQNECILDIDCSGDDKCCYGACGTFICVSSAEIEYYPQCPALPEESGLCLDTCTLDSNCTTGQLCCDNGCGLECMNQVVYDPQTRMISGGADVDRLELRLCEYMGEMVPTGRQIQTNPSDPCFVCVCVNGVLECVDDESCSDGAQPTCSCGPEGSDLAMQDIPFGTVWHVAKCDLCVCLNGTWQCQQLDQCRPDVPLPRPCQISELVSVPTGYMTDNRCCICIDGTWTCETPGCELIEVTYNNCPMEGEAEVHHGAFTVEDCILCICVNGMFRCHDICGVGGGGSGESGVGSGSGNGDDGVCPAATTRCPAVAFQQNQCFVDADCPDAQSVCCTNGCVNICIVTTDGAGTASACPAQMMPCSEDEMLVNQCATDTDCAAGEVCCRGRRGCAGQCVAVPALPRPGVCPSVTLPPASFADIPTEGEEGNEVEVIGDCTDDAGCSAGLKCCGATVKQCVIPMAQPAPEQCTDSDGNARDSGAIVVGDPDPNTNLCEVCVCIDGEWVCESQMNCTSTDAKPCDNPGQEPAQNGQAIVLECLIRVCFNGAWLSRDLQACRPERVIKSGDCPRGDNLQPRDTCPADVDPDCRGDQECSGSLKCCYDGCSLSCQQAVAVRSGECPTVTIGDVEGPCTPDLVDECTVDSDCSNAEQKCCFDGCRSTCQQPQEEPEVPVCLDMNDPTATPFSNGQIVPYNMCDICVCVGKDWVCTYTPEAACNGSVPLTCFDGTGAQRDVPHGTLERRGCMQRLCLNGTWTYNISIDCCPDLSSSCYISENVIIATGENNVQIDGDVCRACVCVDGILVCQEFAATECQNNAVPAAASSCWRGGQEIPLGTTEPGENPDEICGCYFGQWRCSGFIAKNEVLDLKPGVCPAQFDLVGLFDIEDCGRGKGQCKEQGGGNNDGRGGGNDNNRGGSNQGQGNRGSNGQGGGWDPSGVAAPGLGSEEEEEEGGVIDVVRGRGQGSGRPDMSRGNGGGNNGGGRGGGMSANSTESPEVGRPTRPSSPGRSRRQTEEGEGEDEEDMEQQEMIQEALDMLDETTFDGCLEDTDCSDAQICCGRDLGGACVEPLPEESIPFPCAFGGTFYRHGYLRDASEGEVCEACVCVHGEWMCDEYICDDGVAECPIGDRSFGISVPSGTQQFLQCELCVCLNGDFRCNERACPNDRSGSFCPAEIPPGINPRNSRYSCASNTDCSSGNICCEYDNFGRVCVPPQLPTVKNGECPADDNRPCNAFKQCLTDSNCPGMMKCCFPDPVLDRCDIGEGLGICTNPSGNPCPGNRPFIPCEDVEPCEAVGECQSNRDLTCLASVCTSCRAAFYDENGNERQCEALQSTMCDVEGRPQVRAGDTVDNPDDPCNKCVCQGNGELKCHTDKKCANLMRLSLSFAAENCSVIIDDEYRRQEFIDQVRQLIEASTGFPAAQIKDFLLDCGSIMTSMTVVQEEGQTNVDLVDLTGQIKQQIADGEMVIIIDGVTYAPIEDTFVAEDVQPGHSDSVKIAIIVVVCVVVVALIIAITVCYLKKRSSSGDHEKGDVPMQSQENKGYR